MDSTRAAHQNNILVHRNVYTFVLLLNEVELYEIPNDFHLTVFPFVVCRCR